MTAFAPGGRLWTRRSGYSSYSLFLRLRPRRRNRRPCITFGSLWSSLLFGIVPRPHHHHGPSRSHLSHRPLQTLIPPTVAVSTRAYGSWSIYLFNRVRSTRIQSSSPPRSMFPFLRSKTKRQYERKREFRQGLCFFLTKGTKKELGKFRGIALFERDV